MKRILSALAITALCVAGWRCGREESVPVIKVIFELDENGEPTMEGAPEAPDLIARQAI